MPPINIDGPNTPPLPPELIVSPVATIFRTRQGQEHPHPHVRDEARLAGRVSSGGMPIAPHCTQP